MLRLMYLGWGLGCQMCRSVAVNGNASYWGVTMLFSGRNRAKGLCVLECCHVLALFVVSCAMHGAEIIHFEGVGAQADLDAEAFFEDDSLTWSAEARIGGASTFELNIHKVVPYTPDPTADTVWSDEQVFAWSVDYMDSGDANPEPDRFVFTVDPDNNPATANSIVLTKDNVVLRGDDGKANNAVWVRSRAVTGSTTTAASTTVADMVLESGSTSLVLGDDAIAAVTQTNSGYRDNLILHNLPFDLMEGFTMTGTGQFAWDGTKPAQSQLAFQVKFGTIPEPSTGLFLASVCMIAVLRRSRHCRTTVDHG